LFFSFMASRAGEEVVVKGLMLLVGMAARRGDDPRDELSCWNALELLERTQCAS
jgi:hypothetical protein